MGRSYSSNDIGVLCFGFLRAVLGAITRADLTGPTRSRAIDFSSVPASYPFLRFGFRGFMINFNLRNTYA